MKKFSRILMMALVAVSTVSMVACEDDDNNTSSDGVITESATYAMKYDGRQLAAGDTIVYQPTSRQITDENIGVDLTMVNKGEAVVSTVVKVELLEGSAKSVGVCFDLCQDGLCPFTTMPSDLAVGETPCSFHFYPAPSELNENALYRFTVGQGASLEDPEVIFVKLVF